MSSLRIVIVGGVAGGMSAATRARRMNEHAHITVLEKGSFISFANCGLPYYLAGQIADERKLLVTDPRSVRDRFNIDVRLHHEVTRIDRTRKFVEVIDHTSGRTMELPYDKLILAPGATPMVPPIGNVRAPNVFLLRSMEDTRAVDAFLKNNHPKSAVIIGAGFIGLEMAEAMYARGLKVTIVEKAPHALPPLDAEMARPITAELERHRIELVVGDGLKSLQAIADRLINVVETESGRLLDADIVMLSIGVRPNVKLAQDAGLTIGASGGIAVDSSQRTSDPDIYAVGDASEVLHGVTGQPARIPLAGPANRQGRLAGEHAAAGAAPPAGKVLGTAIVKLFDLTIGITGLNERAARQAGFDVDAAYVLPSHHAGYYPGAQPMRIKLVYDKPTGKVLGAQISGGAGVDKRLDVIATTIHFGGTIDDLASLDLAYAPQFGSAKDAVHFAAFAAQNQLRGLTRAVTPDELSGAKLVDVRTAGEHAASTLRGAINIPLDELRQRATELDPSQPIIAFCQAGLRGYIAQRMLSQLGFKNVKNLKGGFSLAREVVSDRVVTEN
jgi:NADPH-dependent 2,4-dienoyl-CoA reductase/sulfur reductase-like enzyme/rhodanese-related sulfurtransferase